MKKIKTNVIDFWYKEPEYSGIVDLPVPAKKEVPEWYKDHPKYNYGDKLVFDQNGPNVSVKTCIPFLDVMTSGYVIKLHCDVLVDEDENMFWKHQVAPAIGRPPSTYEKIPQVPGYGKFAQVWNLLFDYKLPKGYSALFTQPFNKFDANTYVTSAIVDADNGTPGGQIPFAIKQGFTGIIEAGTPIIQIIPFKRENWKMNFHPGKSDFQVWNDKRKIVGWYKHNIWKRKSFD